MKTQNNKQKYWKIPKPDRNLKLIIKYILLGIAFTILIILFIEIIVKLMILGMINILITLVKVYANNLDNINILFFGGMIFLFIGYKVYEILIHFWIKSIEWIIQEYRK